tara:strand:- start:1234 stop:1944 length:711 start_codon:yes stop_codon:yes gene_type:complete
MGIGNPVTLTGNIDSKIISVTATSGQTQITVTGGYNINALTVYRNGAKLTQGRDFTATDGATVTLVTPAVLGDVIDFHVFEDFKVSDAIRSAESDQTIHGNLTVTGSLNVKTGGQAAYIGISSAGDNVGTAKTLNFIGAGNTFNVNGDTIDISIQGGGGGGIGTAIKLSDGNSSVFSYIDSEAIVNENIVFNADNAGVNTSYVVTVIPKIIVANGIGMTVGTGKTMVIDALQLGDL